MGTVQERVGVLETKVEVIDEKIDNLKEDIKESHEDIKSQLKTMYDASCAQHAGLSVKIAEIEKLKDKWTYTFTGLVVAISILSGHYDKLAKLFN